MKVFYFTTTQQNNESAGSEQIDLVEIKDYYQWPSYLYWQDMHSYSYCRLD